MSALLADAPTETPAVPATANAPAAPASQTPPAPAQPASTETPPKPAATTEPGAPEQPKPEGAPEHYDFKVPDGVELDSVVRGSFEKVARELNLTQSNAQRLLDEVLPTMHKRAQEETRAVHDKWIADVKADPEIGGSQLEQSKQYIAAAKKAFATEGLQKLLEGPLGDHPELARLFVRVGKLVSEDRFVGGRNEPKPDFNDEAAMAARLYPNSPRA